MLIKCIILYSQIKKVEKGRETMFSFREHLQKYGIKPLDVPKAILVFKGISYVTWFSTMALCYRYKPLQKLAKRPFGQHVVNGIKTKYPDGYAKTHAFILRKAQQLANWRFFKPIPEHLGLKTKRFTFAIAENTVLYKLALPVLLPAQFWLTIHAVRSKDSKAITVSDMVEGSKGLHLMDVDTVSVNA